MEVQLSDSGFEKDVLKSSKPVLVDFWAPWCGPCRMLGPIVEEVAKEYAGKVVVGKMNTDENPDTASRYNISAIPTMLLFKGGQVVGSSNKTAEEVETRPVYPVDLLGSIYQLAGVDPATALPHPMGLDARVLPGADDKNKSAGLLTEIM